MNDRLYQMCTKDFEGTYILSERPENIEFGKPPERIHLKAHENGLDVYDNASGDLLFRLSYPNGYIPLSGLRISFMLELNGPKVIVENQEESASYIKIK